MSSSISDPTSTTSKVPSISRCPWPKSDLDIAYHDTEWGVPVHDDRTLFEFLILEGAQAGLSWSTILKKRDNYRQAFDNFDVNKVAMFDDTKCQALMLNPGIVRNKLKIASTVLNAKAFIAVQQEFGSFDKYIWGWVIHQPIVNHWKSLAEYPVKTDLSDKISKDLLKRGFKFVGSTICYSYVQAIGMVNDHTIDCFRHAECCHLA